MQTERIDRGDGVELAFEHVPGASPAIVFLGGYGSDMTGDKATALAGLAAAGGHGFLRLDYSGHGASGGAFADGTVGRWMLDALAVIDHAAPGPMLLVGSSMGGWIGLLIARRRMPLMAGFVGVAAAPDFTERLMWQAMTPPERAALARDGALPGPDTYGAPRPVTRALIEDGRRHLLLEDPIEMACPVRLLHGQRDADVPWETAMELSRALACADVQVTLVKDGEHRLSRPSDLALLRRTVRGLLGEDGGQSLAKGRMAPGDP
jgi:pimeloyl-ACP methyl ester carboxylesterase